MEWKPIAFGAGIGYVLGDRAGEDRFKQIQGWWRDVTESPAVRRATEQVVGQAQQLAARARFGDSEEDERESTTDEEGERSSDREDAAGSALARVGRFLSEARERGRIA